MTKKLSELFEESMNVYPHADWYTEYEWRGPSEDRKQVVTAACAIGCMFSFLNNGERINMTYGRDLIQEATGVDVSSRLFFWPEQLKVAFPEYDIEELYSIDAILTCMDNKKLIPRDLILEWLRSMEL